MSTVLQCTEALGKALCCFGSCRKVKGSCRWAGVGVGGRGGVVNVHPHLLPLHTPIPDVPPCPAELWASQIHPKGPRFVLLASPASTLPRFSAPHPAPYPLSSPPPPVSLPRPGGARAQSATWRLHGVVQLGADKAGRGWGGSEFIADPRPMGGGGRGG